MSYASSARSIYWKIQYRVYTWVRTEAKRLSWGEMGDSRVNRVALQGRRRHCTMFPRAWWGGDRKLFGDEEAIEATLIFLSVWRTYRAGSTSLMKKRLRLDWELAEKGTVLLPETLR